MKSIESSKGTIAKVTQYESHYTVITAGIVGVTGWQPKLLYYSRSDVLDAAFDRNDMKPFALIVSQTIGRMK